MRIIISIYHQMKHSAQEYIQLYRNLDNVEHAKSANRALLALQQSRQAWSIAEELMSSKDMTNFQHGCNLLSKCLNRPLPQYVQFDKLLSAIFKQTPGKLLWLSTAKLLLHMRIPNYEIPWNLSDQQKLCILQEIPHALAQVRVNYELQIPAAMNGYFQRYKPLLINNFQICSILVLECISGFITNNVRLKSAALLHLIISKEPLPQEAYSILQEVFLHQSYPEMREEILHFLNKNLGKSNILPIYLAYYSSIEICALPNAQLKFLLGSLIGIITRDEQNPCGERVALNDTFEFWKKVSDQIRLGSFSQENGGSIMEAFLALWSFVAKISLLKKLPISTKKQIQTFIIDVDEIGEVEKANISVQKEEIDENKQIFWSRKYTPDFFVVILSAIRVSPPIHQQIFKLLGKICETNLCELELVLFIIESIADSLTQEQMSLISQLFKKIMVRQQQFNEYLCQKISTLLGRLSNILMVDFDLLPIVLSFFGKALSFQSLAPLASESFCELMEQIDADKVSAQFSGKMQEFLSVMYNVFYASVRQQSVFQKLTRALIVFIYKFKHTGQHYQGFLKTYADKIRTLTEQKQKIKYLECIITAQFWLNSQCKEPYIHIFSNFIAQFLDVLLVSCLTSKKKSEIIQMTNLINMAIKTQGLDQIEAWAHLIDGVLQYFSEMTKKESVLMSMLSNLIKYGGNCKIVGELTHKWQPYFTLTLQNLKPYETNETFLNNFFNLHIAIVQTLQKNLSINEFYQYNSDKMTQYICEEMIPHSENNDYNTNKLALNYLQILMNLGFSGEKVLNCIMPKYRTINNILPSQTQNLIIAACKKDGIQPFTNIITKIKPDLLPPNPFWQRLIHALKEGQSKQISNILLVLD